MYCLSEVVRSAHLRHPVRENSKALLKRVTTSVKIAQVSSTSANGDSIGTLIAATMRKVGSNCVLTVEEAKMPNDKFGEFNQDYISPHFMRC